MATGAALIEKWPELRKLSAKQVVDGAKRCAAEEREAGFRLLLYLTEVERQRAYEEAGKRSLWPFIEETLGFTEYETRLRFYSTKALIDFPETAEYLADGRLSMTTLVLLKDVLTKQNVRDWCKTASNKSKSEVEEEISKTRSEVRSFFSITEAPAIVIEIDPGTPAGESVAETTAASDAAPTSGASQTALPSTPGKDFLVRNAPSKASVKALTTSQAKLNAIVPKELIADLREVSDLLSEIFPDKDEVKVLGYCLKEVKKRLLKKRGVVEPKPKATEPKPESGAREIVNTCPEEDAPEKKYRMRPITISNADRDLAIAGRNRDGFKRVAIPMETLRFVWERDNYCCQRRLKNGEICGSTYQCQIDHMRAVADGGSNDPSNLRVHCRMHNLQRARERFGTERIARAIANRKETSLAKNSSPKKAKSVKPPTLFQ